ncbi:MAG: His Kinase A (phospho-acceptor) domain-containing protein [Candidatus Electronema aureum]|uniref:histidine kinase n=1 Tax=Candidatus Electronema aureum TaxID=2005002 RepID=A0A521G004_9BACT|nr:MAG: His Kinase A (phospho-acceptor) domain-containing protein [Candidatus Electronema aureum]
MKLLIADDELSTRILLRHCAARWGYEVIEAADGLEAMTILRSPEPPRIAVLDWMMPGLDGVEICSRLNAQEKGAVPLIYTILLTGRSDKEDVVHALDHGAHDFLSKPVHIGELHSRISVGRRLVEAHDRLLELDKIKDRFLRIAAHDLRNPLGYIITMTEMLMDSSFFEMRSNIDTHLLAINETATAMQRLINDLLDVSAVGDGTFKINRQPASLTEVLRQAAQLQQQAAAKKQIVIVERLTTLPIFNLDPSRIRQAVDNLLSNAVKHSPAGSVVVLSAEQAGSAVRVAVADQGPGLSEKELEHLFADPAGPADSRKDSRLGWAVVKKIIELHGGVLRAENQAERGCVFSFTLSAL